MDLELLFDYQQMDIYDIIMLGLFIISLVWLTIETVKLNNERKKK